MSQAKLYLSKADDGLRLSHEEFADAEYQEPWRYERVDGRLLVMNPSGHDHHATSEPFRDHLGAYKLSHPDVVEMVVSEAWMFVDKDTDRIADIGVYLKKSTGRIPDRIPELVYEIVSQTAADRRRDYEEKRVDYERAGIAEYVIVDRFAREVTVFRLARKKYREAKLGLEDVYTTPLLPGLVIPLKDVL
jgi:Uma2 family endonuclease